MNVDKVLRKIGFNSGSDSTDQTVEDDIGDLADGLMGDTDSEDDSDTFDDREKEKLASSSKDPYQEIVRSSRFITKFYLTHNGSELYYTTDRGKLCCRSVDKSFVVARKNDCQRYVRDIHVTKDEKLLITGGDSCIMLYSLPSLNHLVTYRGKSAEKIFCVTCCLPYKQVFAGSSAGRLQCWDVQAGDELPLFRGVGAPKDDFDEIAGRVTLPHGNIVYKLMVFRKSLFSGSQDGTIKQWDLIKGALLSCIKSYTPILNFRFSHEADFLKSCKYIILGDFQTMEVSKITQTPDESVPRTVAISSKPAGVTFFDDVTNFTILEEMNMLIAWNKKLSEIQLIDLKYLVVVWALQIPVVAVHDLRHDYNSFQYSHELAMDDEKMMEFHKRFFIYFRAKKSLYRVRINRKWLWSLQSQHLQEYETLEKEGRLPSQLKQKAESLVDSDDEEEKKKEGPPTNLFQQMLKENRSMFLGLGSDSESDSDSDEEVYIKKKKPAKKPTKDVNSDPEDDDGIFEEDNFSDDEEDEDEDEEAERKRERERKRRRRRRRKRLIKRGKMSKLKIKGKGGRGGYKCAGERFFFDNGVMEKKKKFVIQRMRTSSNSRESNRRASRNLGRNFGKNLPQDK